LASWGSTKRRPLIYTTSFLREYTLPLPVALFSCGVPVRTLVVVVVVLLLWLPCPPHYVTRFCHTPAVVLPGTQTLATLGA